jgi:hypothetical protein
MSPSFMMPAWCSPIGIELMQVRPGNQGAREHALQMPGWK